MVEREYGEKKRRTGCFWSMFIMGGMFAVMVFIGLFAIIALKSAFSGPSLAAGSKKFGADEFPMMKEVWASGHGDTKVVAIPITGMIMLKSDNSGLFPSETEAQRALRSIRRATHDKKVKAIILEIDSGGGGITASDVIYKALQDFKKSEKGRYVVSIFGDVAASGAYYIALASDYIIAHPTTITGSIGVLIHTMNIHELGNKLGVKDVTIKSGKNKDLLNPMTELNPEQKQLVQNIVDHMYNRFVKLVAENRNIDVSVVKKLADGRIYSAEDALNLRLIDSIGYSEDAEARVAGLLGVEDVKIYRYEQEKSFSALFKGMQHWNPIQGLMRGSMQPELLYQWSL